MNRGSCGCQPTPGRTSNGFNEAPIHESGKSGRDLPRPPFALIASMRPRFMNRGSHDILQHSAVSHGASMRPRFMNRGSDRRRYDHERSDPASMRPRFMNRGSAPPSHGESHHPSSFNEAPIHESGKFGVTAAQRAQRQRASMRPRFMNRGSACTALATIPARRSFNEAPIHESGKCRPAPNAGAHICCFNEAPIHESGK